MRTESIDRSRLWVAVAVFLLAPRFVCAQTTFVQPRITSAIDNTSRVTIPHSTHPLAVPAFDAGALDGSTPMQRMILVLDGSADQDYQLSVLLDSQQTQGSPDYHHWLTPDEFGRRFGPAPQDIQVVSGWLVQQGFSVGQVAHSGRWIEFSGTAGQVETAFQTQMRRYQVRGEAHIANSTDISIPAALAPVVRGVASLHDFFSKPMLSRYYGVERNTQGKLAPVGPDYTQGSSHFLSPDDFAKIYDTAPLLTAGTNGSGEIIAIVARSDVSLTDVHTFRTMFGLPANTTNVIVNGTDPGVVTTTGDGVEAALDTEWSGAVAPNATIDVVASESTLIVDGVDLSASYIVDQNLAPIMSVSFGGCEADEGTLEAGNESFFLNALWQQASAQGISVFVSTGDSGAAGCDPDGESTTGAQSGVAISGEASTPFDTAVGGTEFNELGAGETPPPATTEATFWSSTNSAGFESALGYIPEKVWNDSCSPTTVGSPCDTAGSPVDGSFELAAGGGGVSTIYQTPSYQTLTITGLQAALDPFFIAGSTTIHPRGIPDVALTASPNNDGYLFCFSGISFLACQTSESGGQTVIDSAGVVGGTSASSPSFAGIMALVDQKIGSNKPQGLANYVLYPLAASETYSSCNSNSRIVPATPSTCVFNDVTVGNNGVPGNDTTGVPAAGDLGFPATAGFDLASGLGSVDANNLVTKWTTAAAAFNGSATALSPTANINITHGATVDLTATVMKVAGGVGPTGNVSLIAEGGTLPSSVGVAASGLTSGSAAFAVNSLPGGTGYNLIASYPGDGTYAGSASNSISVTVAKEASSIVVLDATQQSLQSSEGNLTNAALSASYGTPVDFEAFVSGKSLATNPNLDGDGNATGTIAITDTLGSTTINLQSAVPLVFFPQQNAGYAEFLNCSGSPNCLAVGTHAVNASYPGDNSFLASNTSPSFTLSITVASATTTTSLSSSAGGTAVNQGTSVTLNATVTSASSGAAPNGTVTFLSGSTQLGSPVTVTGTPGNRTFFGVGAFAGATASLTTTALPVGTDGITAKYSGDVGDSNYLGSQALNGVTISVQSTAPGFTVTAVPSTVPVSAPGSSGSTTLMFTAINGFSSNGAATVAPVCAGMPLETTCSSGASINLATNGTATAMLTFQTTAPSSVVPFLRNPPNISGWQRTTISALALACAFCMALLALGYRGKQRRWGFALVFTIFVMLAVGAGCGGGGGGRASGNPGTPAPSNTAVTVSITINGVTENVPNLTLNVQ
jgi:large repetitive protein